MPGVLPGPVDREVQSEAAGAAAGPGGHVDQLVADGAGAGAGVGGAGECAGGAQQVVGECGQGEPGGVGGEAAGGEVGERGGVEVGEDLFDDGVVAVLGLGGG